MKECLPFVDWRAVFSKTGSARYFSHLDLTRAAARALRRSGLDIWMTEGFTPRPHMVFTPPLPLGYESECELMDFRLNTGAEMDKAAIIAAFPPALPVREIYEPENKLKEIAFARYSVRFRSQAEPDAVKELFSHPVMLVKRTKRSEQTVDITEYIAKLDCSGEGGVLTIDATLPCSADRTLSPAYLIQGMEQAGFSPARIAVRRTAFYDEDMTEFR